MSADIPSPLVHFADIPDLRDPRGIRHSLQAITGISILTVISGADGFDDILALKDDHRTMHAVVQCLFGHAGEIGWEHVRHDHHQTLDRGTDRKSDANAGL